MPADPAAPPTPPAASPTPDGRGLGDHALRLKFAAIEIEATGLVVRPDPDAYAAAFRAGHDAIRSALATPPEPQ